MKCKKLTIKDCLKTLMFYITFPGKSAILFDRTIDQPFYEDMDAFVAAMRDLSISNYTTTNRIGVTEIVQSYVGYGVPYRLKLIKQS